MDENETKAPEDYSAHEERPNPFLQHHALPRFYTCTPDHLTPAMTELVKQLGEDFSALETRLSSEDSNCSYDDILPEVERMQHPVAYAWGIAGHLMGVANSAQLRDSYEENQPAVVKAFTKFSQSRALFDALTDIEEQWKNENDDAKDAADEDFYRKQKLRAVENTLRDMKLGGVGLEGDAKNRFNEIKLRLAELSTSFSNNVLDATKTFHLDVVDANDVRDVPESARAMWSVAFATSEIKPAAEKGPWRITLDAPSYIAAMSHIPNREIRERIYKARLIRASEFDGDVATNTDDDKGESTSVSKDEKDVSETPKSMNNVPHIYEILKLKKERAQMLGFQNPAEVSLASKMAPSVKSVIELSNLILEKALPAAQRELEEITALARAEGGEEYSPENIESLMPWDITFWSERLKEKKFDLKEEDLRPYFALPSVLEGLFGLVARLFNIEVRKANGEAPVWHEDVSFFKIYDKDTEQHIASFYLDPYSRPATKRGGAWMNDCVGKSEALRKDIPVAYLICNGTSPVDDKPALMTFREVETLFHEFGHGLQHMLTRATVGDVAGINGIEWDAVELPSQFMENWCYDRNTIYGFAKHYETGEPLPEDMFEKLKEQKTYGAGMGACRQLLFGLMDMELHSNFDAEAFANGGESIFDVHRRIAAKCTPYSPPLEEDRFLCSFSHIFAGGYSAGYYSYKWAEVMSADAFGAFEEVGLENEDKVKEIGRKFRETVLSLGGGIEPMTVFKEFRGREPSPEALLRHNGLD